MNIVKVLRAEETKLEKEAGRITHRLNSIRAAIHALNGTSNRTATTKRKLSAAARARIAKAQKLRWAKVRQANAKAKS